MSPSESLVLLTLCLWLFTDPHRTSKIGGGSKITCEGSLHSRLTILHFILFCPISELFLPLSENCLLEYFFNLATKNPSILWVCEKNLLVSFKEGWKCFPLNLEKYNRKITSTTNNKTTIPIPLPQRITTVVPQNPKERECNKSAIQMIENRPKCHSLLTKKDNLSTTQNVKFYFDHVRCNLTLTFNLVVKFVVVICWCYLTTDLIVVLVLWSRVGSITMCHNTTL